MIEFQQRGVLKRGCYEAQETDKMLLLGRTSHLMDQTSFQVVRLGEDPTGGRVRTWRWPISAWAFSAHEGA